MFKQFALLALTVLISAPAVFAQDSVTVYFRYSPATSIFRAYLPGEFNNWGPNSAGTIAVNAPSLMTLENGVYTKSVRLKIGGGSGTSGGKNGYQYKIHEHKSSDGKTWNWLADPLNPIKYGGDGNSLVIVQSPMVFQIQPQNASATDNPQPAVLATVASKNSDPVDETKSEIYLNDQLLGTFGSFYDKNRQFLNVPSLSSFGASLSSGANEIKIKAITASGATFTDSTSFSFLGSTIVIKQRTPAGIIEGINYYPADPTKVTLCLFAPRKKTVHVIGDFNNWLIDNAYLMKMDSVNADSVRWWLTLTGLESGKEYGFQYLVDGNLRIADPYAEKILFSDDQWIPSVTYPNLKPYPADKTTFAVSVLQTNQTPYTWQVTNFERPKKEDLVVYELLIRDFVARHDYQTLIDTLGYLKRLGINAIELMPVQEFDGNESWGYNPAFYFAPDKYYGTKNDLKKFIDVCHQNGIAVIMDVVYNHMFGQSSFLRLYASGDYGPATAQNYWFNVTAKHPYNVGYDMNHESIHSQYLLDRANKHWLTEYKVDGYRYDLSKGFTQVNYGEDVGAWSGYDQSRINILKRMYNKVRETDATSYMILEHLGANTEEKELATHGFMLWGNMNSNFNEATMGWNESGKSDLSWGAYTARGWTSPNVVTYAESHDEERLMYKNLQYGNVSGTYSIKSLPTALNRIKLASAFLLGIPGPKMIWQFGELGYDISIDFNGRVGNKPIKWEYLANKDRLNLYKTMAELIKLKITEPAFETTTFSQSVTSTYKRINLTHSDMDVAIIGNFGVVTGSVSANFSKAGKWYRFFEGDSLEVTNTNEAIPLAAGEFKVFTTKRLHSPEKGIVTAVGDDVVKAGGFILEQNYPNPFNPETSIRFSVATLQMVKVVVYDLMGREIATVFNGNAVGENLVTWDGKTAGGVQAASGMYFYKLIAGDRTLTKKMLLIR
ncbi:MAG: T9SS type A sorting domain-containing protein [Bacteroidetes bacterium]|nr:T9SS type A sorting domain-containing protein [Bacteroidota bacterium]